MRNLRALTIEEERALAGRVAGLLYLTGAVTMALMLILPGIEVRHAETALVIAGLAALWGLICLYLLPWPRIRPWVSHFSSGAGLPLTAAAVYFTGGANSPADLYLFFIVVYASYFYPPREAIPHLLACAVVVAVPFLYDSNAVEDGLLAELLILSPTYFVLGGLIMGGKAVLVELSHKDALTEIANRRAFVECVEAHTNGRRRDERFGLMLIDLDGFKNANTIYGHPGGDEVLRRCAAALATATRDGDLLARLGGDEFAIVVGGAHERGMEALRDRIHRCFADADEELAYPAYKLQASMGWAFFPDDATDPDELISKADAALLAAKLTAVARRTPHAGREGAGGMAPLGASS